MRFLLGTGSAVSSTAQTSTYGLAGYFNNANQTASTFNNAELYIPNYAGSTNKSFSVDSVNENNATLVDTAIMAGLWANTAAITSISIAGFSQSITQYSTASLYGILKGSGGASVS
jgi:hypothetical protein